MFMFWVPHFTHGPLAMRLFHDLERWFQLDIENAKLKTSFRDSTTSCQDLISISLGYCVSQLSQVLFFPLQTIHCKTFFLSSTSSPHDAKLARKAYLTVQLAATCYLLRPCRVPTGSNRFQQVPTGSNRFQQVPTGSNRFLQVPTGSNRFQQVPTGSNNQRFGVANLPMCGFNLFHLVSTPRHCFQPFSNTSDRWPDAYRIVSCHAHKDLPASHGNELCDKRYGPHWQRSPQLHTQTCVILCGNWQNSKSSPRSPLLQSSQPPSVQCVRNLRSNSTWPYIIVYLITYKFIQYLNVC